MPLSHAAESVQYLNWAAGCHEAIVILRTGEKHSGNAGWRKPLWVHGLSTRLELDRASEVGTKHWCYREIENRRFGNACRRKPLWVRGLSRASLSSEVGMKTLRLSRDWKEALWERCNASERGPPPLCHRLPTQLNRARYLDCAVEVGTKLYYCWGIKRRNALRIHQRWPSWRHGLPTRLNWAPCVTELQEMAGNINRFERSDEMLWGHQLVLAPLIP